MNQTVLRSLIAVAVAIALCACHRGHDPAAMSLELVAPPVGTTVPATVWVAADVVGGVDPITVTFAASGSAPVVKSALPFSGLLPLSGGDGATVTITATARDARGAQAVGSIQVTIDRRLPPPDGAAPEPDASTPDAAPADAGPSDAGSSASPDAPEAGWLGPVSGVEFVISGAPALGAQAQPAAVWNGQHTFVAWSDGRDPQRARIFGARVAPDGSLLDPTGIPLVAGTQPRLGWNGQSHLLVYRDQLEASNGRLVARRFAADGTVLAGEPVVLTTKPSALEPPAIGSNGDGFLIAWIDHRNEISQRWARLYAARVDAGGRLLDPQGLRLTSDDYEPDGVSDLSVAWNGQTYLVSWVGPFGVMVSRVARDGGLFSPAALQVSYPGGHPRHPALDFDGTSNLVVWDHLDYPDDSRTLWAAHVNPAVGARDQPMFPIEPMGGNPVRTRPLLAWMGTHHVLLWNELDQMRSARLSPAGDLLDRGSFEGPRQVGPSPVLAGGPSGSLLVGTSADTTHAGVLGWRVRTDAQFEEGPPLRISTSAVTQRQGTLAWNGTRYLAVWQDHYFEDPQLKVQLLDQAGRTLSSEASALAESIVPTVPPAVASNGKDFLVVWETTAPAGGLKASFMAGDGSTAGAKDIVVSRAPGRQTLPAVVWTGTTFLVAWIDTRGGAGDATSVHAARIDNAGTNLDPDSFLLGDTTGASTVSVAGGRGGLLLVWQDGPAGRVRAQPLSVDGVAQGKPFAIADTSRRQESPTVAWSETDYLVAWSEWRDGAQADLFGARVSARGEVRDGGGGFAICQSAQGQGAPRATWNGTNFLVAWRDERKSTKASTMADVYAARVSPTGQVLDPDGFAVAATEEYEDAPALAGRGDGAALVMWQQYDPAPAVRSLRVSMRIIAETAKDEVTPRGESEPCAADWQCRSGLQCIVGSCCASCGGAPDAGP
jgi:hypothetical protein